MDLVEYNELPEWYKNNEYIITGYRKPDNNIKNCLTSMFHIHNETFNIWSHLLGGIIFLILIGITFLENLNITNKLILTGYCLFIMFALFASASYHTFMHHSHEIQTKCILIDYQGVVFIIFASSSILIYNTFHQYIMLLIIYISIIAFVSSLISIMIHDSKWNNIERKPFRALIFALQSACLIVPVVHGCFISDIYSLLLLALGLVLGINGIGGAFYATKFPEIIYSNPTLDHIGNSHNIMHVFILIASIVHFFVMKYIMNYLEK